MTNDKWTCTCVNCNQPCDTCQCGDDAVWVERCTRCGGTLNHPDEMIALEKKYHPGWGTSQGALEFLWGFRDACKQNPDAYVVIL